MTRQEELAAIDAALNTDRHHVCPALGPGELTPAMIAQFKKGKEEPLEVPEAKAKGSGTRPRRQAPRLRDTRRIDSKRDTAAQREQTIRERAYALYEADNYQHGRDVEHWLRAEAEIARISK
jgi:hypothetical protein